MQEAWNLVNDSLRLPICIRFKSTTIACACIYLAARRKGIALPENPPWWDILKAPLANMEEVAREILLLYTLPRPVYISVNKGETAASVDARAAAAAAGGDDDAAALDGAAEGAGGGAEARAGRDSDTGRGASGTPLRSDAGADAARDSDGGGARSPFDAAREAGAAPKRSPPAGWRSGSTRDDPAGGGAGSSAARRDARDRVRSASDYGGRDEQPPRRPPSRAERDRERGVGKSERREERERDKASRHRDKDRDRDRTRERDREQERERERSGARDKDRDRSKARERDRGDAERDRARAPPRSDAREADRVRPDGTAERANGGARSPADAPVRSADRDGDGGSQRSAQKRSASPLAGRPLPPPPPAAQQSRWQDDLSSPLPPPPGAAQRLRDSPHGSRGSLRSGEGQPGGASPMSSTGGGLAESSDAHRRAGGDAAPTRSPLRLNGRLTQVSGDRARAQPPAVSPGSARDVRSNVAPSVGRSAQPPLGLNNSAAARGTGSERTSARPPREASADVDDPAPRFVPNHGHRGGVRALPGSTGTAGFIRRDLQPHSGPERRVRQPQSGRTGGAVHGAIDNVDVDALPQAPPPRTIARSNPADAPAVGHKRAGGAVDADLESLRALVHKHPKSGQRSAARQGPAP